MAGLGFKDFQVGEVLTSADVDGYLMQQTVMRFADAGARGSALGTAAGTSVPLAEGMVSYLQDANAVELYDGSAWIGLGGLVQTTYAAGTAAFTTTSTSFVDVTDVRVTLAPVSTSNDIYLFAFLPNATVTGGPFPSGYDVQIRRDSATNVLPADVNVTVAGNGYNTSITVVIRDQPATTSSVQYDLRVKTAAGTFSVNRAILLAMEVRL